MLPQGSIPGADRMAYLVRILMQGAAVAGLAACLSACALDEPASARAFADRWLHVDAQTYFTSQRGCTVAVYRLSSGTVRAGGTRVYDLRQGIGRLRTGQAVAFGDPNGTPDGLSRAIMSADLPVGLGLLSSVTGPRACMTDEVAQGVGRMIATPGVMTIYDPAENIVILLDAATRHAVLMRGEV